MHANSAPSPSGLSLSSSLPVTDPLTLSRTLQPSSTVVPTKPRSYLFSRCALPCHEDKGARERLTPWMSEQEEVLKEAQTCKVDAKRRLDGAAQDLESFMAEEGDNLAEAPEFEEAQGLVKQYATDE